MHLLMQTHYLPPTKILILTLQSRLLQQPVKKLTLALTELNLVPEFSPRFLVPR